MPREKNERAHPTPPAADNDLTVEELSGRNIRFAIRQFWFIMVTIIGAAFSVGLMYANIKADIRVSTTRIDQLDEGIGEVKASLENFTDRQIDIVSKLQRLELEIERLKD